ncbi:Elongation factor 1-alpha [Nosema granulosis]|uniref:Elongation factor 1-alpha n=1 Tax=Nosema granulosis TaxID=83296 RepID=A0A9P6GY76_9MICR|nr:Elongation factor 1-alpha [Nosema granulosis]
MAEAKPTKQLNVCFIGHVDSGKSTCVGNLAFQLGAVDKRVMEKYKKEASTNDKSSFCYAYVCDNTAAEKERGITISTTLIKICTKKFALNVLDCPGHKDFIKNMVTGAAQADVGVVIVPASGFEACVGEGGILKAHITISAVLGCSKLIVCVNKMDEIEESRREARFNEIKSEMLRIAKLYHSDKNPIIIPISAFHNYNLVESSPKYEWFKGWVDAKTKTVINSLEAALDFQEEPARMFDKPLRMPIVQKHKISGIGFVYTGRIDTGVATPNMQVCIEPAGVVTEIKSLEIHREAKQKVVAGENCGVAFKNASKGDFNQVKPGNVISDAKNNPCKMFKGCVAKLVVVDKPTGLAAGYAPTLDLGIMHVPVKVHKILKKKSPKDPQPIDNPERIEQNDNAMVVLIPQKPCVMEAASEFPSLGRFALRDSNKIVCIGSIVKVCTDEELASEYGLAMDKKVGDKKKK